NSPGVAAARSRGAQVRKSRGAEGADSTRRWPGQVLFSKGEVKISNMSLSAGKLTHMKALSNKEGIIAAAAMDQRGSLQKSIASAKGVDTKAVTPEMMSEFKVAVSRILTPHATA